MIEVDTQSNTYLQIDESIRKFKENIIQRHTKEIYQEYLLSNSVWYFENFKKVITLIFMMNLKDTFLEI